jgi:hypothetical protein
MHCYMKVVRGTVLPMTAVALLHCEMRHQYMFFVNNVCNI